MFKLLAAGRLGALPTAALIFSSPKTAIFGANIGFNIRRARARRTTKPVTFLCSRAAVDTSTCHIGFRCVVRASKIERASLFHCNGHQFAAASNGRMRRTQLRLQSVDRLNYWDHSKIPISPL
jgi:hypothetical protein